jgi:DNA-binding response OmpR family regulator
VSETERRVVVLADDLIWASRLVAAAERAGATAIRATSALELQRRLDEGGGAAVIVDLGGRRYDGVAAVQLAAVSGRPTIAVGQHEDQALRRRALDAGAQRVYSYNKLFRDGPAVIAGLFERAQPGVG